MRRVSFLGTVIAGSITSSAQMTGPKVVHLDLPAAFFVAIRKQYDLPVSRPSRSAEVASAPILRCQSSQPSSSTWLISNSPFASNVIYLPCPKNSFLES